MRLLTKEVAAMVGLKEPTIRRYRARGSFPEPDGYTLGHPWWNTETVDAWMKNRAWARTQASRIVEGGSNAP